MYIIILYLLRIYNFSCVLSLCFYVRSLRTCFHLYIQPLFSSKSVHYCRIIVDAISVDCHQTNFFSRCASYEIIYLIGSTFKCYILPLQGVVYLSQSQCLSYPAYIAIFRQHFALLFGECTAWLAVPTESPPTYLYCCI